MARKIVVTGGKGGVGKTTVALCLAAQLSKKGQRVILCDADFGLNNVDVAAGVEHLVTYDIVDVIEGKCRAKQALIRHPKYTNLYVLASSHSSPERYVSPQSFKVVLEALAPQFDFIFIDCPTGIEEGFHRAVASADEAIIVTTPQVSAIRDGDKVLTLLKSYRLQSISLLVNMVKGERLASGEGIAPKEIAELLKLPLLGVIPEDYALSGGELSEIHTSLRMAAFGILTGKSRLYDPTKKYGGLFGNIRRVLKRKL